jgi:hypothetical protein
VSTASHALHVAPSLHNVWALREGWTGRMPHLHGGNSGLGFRVYGRAGCHTCMVEIQLPARGQRLAAAACPCSVARLIAWVADFAVCMPGARLLLRPMSWACAG